MGSFAALLLLLLVAASTTIMTTRSFSLEGKRVLVTGSSGGIGKGIACLIAKQGGRLLIHYHQRVDGAQQTAEEIRQAGGTVDGIVQCDFRNSNNIHCLFTQEIDRIWPDGLDVVVNNAGAVTKQALEDDTDDLQAWHETLAVNLHAPRLISHLALRRMSKQGGVILNVSSIHGERSNEFMGAYAVSKSGLDALTRTMAIEYAPRGVRVNAIAPGVVPVERTATAFANDHEMANGWKSRIPLGKLGTVDQVAGACLSLLTNEWITGSVWQVDGGMMARSNMPERKRPPPLPS